MNIGVAVGTAVGNGVRVLVGGDGVAFVDLGTPVAVGAGSGGEVRIGRLVGVGATPVCEVALGDGVCRDDSSGVGSRVVVGTGTGVTVGCGSLSGD